MKKIYSELSRIQQELKAPKTLFNKFGNYYYRNAEGILEAVKPMLNGLALVINDEPVLVGDRFYVKATVTLTDGEDSVSAVAYAREDEQKKGMDGCQITGACSSYARKYALNALLMIDDSKDSDDDSLSPKNPENAKATKEPVRQPERVTDSFTPPAPITKASVIVGGKLPPAPKEETPPPSPVMAFLTKALVGLREQRGISATANNKLFKDQREALIAAKLAPNKKLEEYTMQEAEALIDAMQACFDPTGTELVTK